MEHCSRNCDYRSKHCRQAPCSYVIIKISPQDMIENHWHHRWGIWRAYYLLEIMASIFEKVTFELRPDWQEPLWKYWRRIFQVEGMVSIKALRFWLNHQPQKLKSQRDFLGLWWVLGRDLPVLVTLLYLQLFLIGRIFSGTYGREK